MNIAPNNPNAFLNGYISMMRNIFLTSSISLASLGYSSKSKLFPENTIKFISLLILLYSICLGLKSACDFNHYLNYMDKQIHTIKEPYASQIKRWKGWITLTYFYIALLVFFAFHFSQDLYARVYN